MQVRLIKEYEGAIRNIQVMPVDEDEGLPLSEIYGSVLVEEDLTALKKTRRLDEPSGSNTLKSVKDLFYAQDKLARRILLEGEAGHGKTVFCLKALDCWSKAKSSGRGAGEGKGGGSVETKVIGKQQTEGARDSGSHRGIDNRFCSLKEGRNPAQISTVKKEDEQLQNCLSLFDLVFYVPLRHAKQGTSSITDLVCGSMSECDKNTEQLIKQMLRDGQIKCLVILDGLDEWRAPDTYRVQGFPDSDGLVNCSLLCTMRPWRMVNLRLGLDSTCDKVVRILGLKSSSIEKVISNVLVHFYGLKPSTVLYKDKFWRFRRKAKLPDLKSLMKIPLMLTASCLVWNEEDDTSNKTGIDQEDRGDSDSDSDSYSDSYSDLYSDSDTSDLNESDPAASYFMTFFYLKLEEITITRAENKHGIVKSFLVEKRQKPERSLYVPNILLGFQQIIDFIEILKLVGRLALQDLVSEEPHLVFPRNKLEREIGHSTVELALTAGILSQTKAPGLSYQQRVSLSFYHKSIQEFIAALYMTCGGTEALTSFRTHCNTVDKVMELSNMIMFVLGLDPVVGCQLSEVINHVSDNDNNIVQYRGGNGANTNRVKELYNMQCKWFREMKQNLSYTHNTDLIPNLHVTDVYLNGHNEKMSVENVSVASELVSMEDNSIVSVYLTDVRYPVYSIIQQLPSCKHLTALYVGYIKDAQDRELLAEVLPQLVQLQCVEYGLPGLKQCFNDLQYHDVRYSSVDMAVVRALQHLQALRHMKLHKIALTDIVTLPPQLETVTLRHVQPADLILPSLWHCSRLIHLVLFNITLTDTVKLPQQLQEIKLVWIHPTHFILQSLPGCPHITSLHINLHLSMKDCEVLASVLPQLKHLQYIHCNGRLFDRVPASRVAVVSALQHLAQVRHINLEDIDLGDADTLLVTPRMTQLQKVELRKVKMSARRWTEFVSSLLCVQHTIHVSLAGTDIDGDTVKTIHTSQHFTVTEEERDMFDNSLKSIKFYTVQ